MNPTVRLRTWLHPFLKVIFLGGALLGAGAMPAQASGQLKTYLALSSYFDTLSSAAGEDPWIEFFGVKETRTFPKSPMICNVASSQSTLLAVSTWIKQVESDLNQNLEVPIFMPKQAEVDLASWLSEDSYKICQETAHQDLSTTQFLYLQPKGHNLALMFEVGYEE
ncbi:MAG: hypothetical protein WCI18_09440 [Pseudomonadota bacterium]